VKKLGRLFTDAPVTVAKETKKYGEEL